MAATGTIAVSGAAWMAVRAHGQDTFVATGSIRVAGLALRKAGAIGATLTPVRLTTGETWPATDADGWTAPSVTPPDIREDA